MGDVGGAWLVRVPYGAVKIGPGGWVAGRSSGLVESSMAV